MKKVFLLLLIFSLSCKEKPKSENKEELINKKLQKGLENSKEKNELVNKEFEVDERSKIFHREKEFIRSFYESYYPESMKMKPNLKIIDSIKNYYCSKNLRERLGSDEYYFGYDPFINAQDDIPNFLKNLKISSSKNNENEFVISISEQEIDYGLLKMELVETNDSLKINNLIMIVN